MALAAVCEEELAKKDTEKSLRILIPRAAIGNQELISALAQVSGLEVSDVPTYDTYYGLDTEEETPALDLAAELSSGGRRCM